ncbi:bacterio-opsin activator domain-containing protein [Halalkalicoccus jeotgali]|uniref:Bacterio-opsin activator-like protein n=1 Tax=Halalkalicoccus jeotgali (strain DSM 18796 / CECT 7217 / JCM 14584 / KCTC 4019 / B3) TaxID=795797 RepID=D8JCJ8_HALJB|nr:bacterio-opsin activator domain-containing protein [Halalkalicoccus jeotgali]ADJ17105.1 bacterio-opsin activator-like protein [Halalkalicoccus jeotgali B3]ELY41740.1 bacterio-opsin activator-like protein [Halalkalicoccus jeotgali B3]
MPRSPAILDSSTVLLVGTSEWVTQFATVVNTQTDATVQRVQTKAEALEVFQRETIDCLISEYAPEETTGLDLLREIRTETTALPVIVGTASGSEAVASEAIGAGVTDYVALTESTDQLVADLLDRTERAVRSAQRSATQRDRARQFDAIFNDSQTATWVLDPDGALTRVNQTAREMIDEDVEAIVGKPFWTLPWWSQTDATEAEVHQIVENALDGTFGNVVISQPSHIDNPCVIDLSVRPVKNERGDLVSIVVEGVDITERVDLERNLRQSEELHRVTLNNMTDTVLITNETGEYTYVCPNVHFIFGYTAAEIREQGPIHELLGEDLFDRDELAEEGVLKNIETTATDKAGREHTLLVNVREVSIQDGTILFSCRDITKRKQREEALATLHETARDFLYTETHQEIAQHVVDDTPGVLNLDASAVYLFDADANELRPAAHSARLKELNGPLPTVRANEETLPSYSFVEDESLFFDDVHSASRLKNRATDLRSAIYIPLGNHGVFIAGSNEVGVFDDVTRELADLLAATAEAALDRITRESRLREQDRTLRAQNEQLTALNRINETIREIDQALVQAETREEIDHTVCKLLTANDWFRFAWIGTIDPMSDTVDPRAWAGTDQGYLDSQSFSVAASGTDPAGQTAATGDATMISNVAAGLRDEVWRKDALARDYLSVLSIPLVYNELTHGVLTVYAPTQDAFDDTAKAVLAELGETIASALSAIERKNALLTTSITRVEFSIDDSAFILSRLAKDAACTLSYQGGVQQSTEGSYVFVTVEDASLEDVAEAASQLVALDDVQQISADGEGGVLRLRLAQPFLALELADHGAVFREATANPTSTTLVIDIPDRIDSRTITQLVRESFSAVELRSKQTLNQSIEQDLYSTFLKKLTERQLEVIQTAYYSGFFESPRERTGEEVAETLGISPPAFYKHARTVQRKLFATLFEENNRSITDSVVG